MPDRIAQGRPLLLLPLPRRGRCPLLAEGDNASINPRMIALGGQTGRENGGPACLKVTTGMHHHVA